MKRLLSILFIALMFAGLAAMPPLPSKPTISLAWDFPVGGEGGNSNWVFRIYQSTNNVDWIAITNVSGMSNRVTLKVDKVEAYFYATTVDARNFWLESDPSNVVSVPAPPPSGANLSISRGDK